MNRKAKRIIRRYFTAIPFGNLVSSVELMALVIVLIVLTVVFPKTGLQLVALIATIIFLTLLAIYAFTHNLGAWKAALKRYERYVFLASMTPTDLQGYRNNVSATKKDLEDQAATAREQNTAAEYENIKAEVEKKIKDLELNMHLNLADQLLLHYQKRHILPSQQKGELE